MRTFKIVIYAALIIFHLTTIILISVGRNNFDFLLNLFSKLDWMMYGAYLGLILFVTTVLFDYLNQKNIKTLQKNHQDEINQLKAKLYDEKEASPAIADAPETAIAEDTNDSTSDDEAATRVD